MGILDDLRVLIPKPLSREKSNQGSPNAGLRIRGWSILGAQLIVCSGCLHLPPVTKPGTGIAQRSAAIVSASSHAIIIPESAFQSALKQSKHYHVDRNAQMQAVGLSATANDARSLGVLGSLQTKRGSMAFHSNLFVVTRDATRSPDGKQVQATDYYVASVEMSGRTPWIGMAPAFGMNQPSAPSTGRCCGPANICVPNQGPIGPCDSGTGICPGLDLGISGINPPTLQARMQSGLPVIGLQVFPDGPPQEVAVPDVLGCTRVIDQVCTMSTPLCDPNDTGYTTDSNGQPDYGSGSASCNGVGTSGGGGGGAGGCGACSSVPEICTMVETAENVIGSCPSQCGDCGGNLFQPFGMPNRLPPGCTTAMPEEGSDVCDPPSPEKQALNNLQMQIISGWTANPGRPSQSCETGEHGIRTCTSCDSGGQNCQQTVNVPQVDPTIADDATSNSEQRAACVCAGDPPTCDGPGCASSGGGSGGGGGTQPNPSTDNPPQAPPPNPPPPDKTVAPPDTPPPASPPNTSGDPTQKASGLDANPSQPGGLGFGWGLPDLADFFLFSQGSAADPVALGDGSFGLRSTDLSFDGPVRALEFRRSYNSRSLDRGTMGSNWHHNWDVRIQPLNIDTVPAWALPFCTGSSTVTTCLLLHDGNGGVTLFFFDIGSRLFMPQAGSTDTITTTIDGGWALRTAAGRILYFNAQGFLVNDRDRFGNGFRIDYENTPLYEMYSHFCNTTTDAQSNTTKYSRTCAVLAYLMEDSFRPDTASDAWHVTLADYPLPSQSDHRYFPLAYARAYFLSLISLGPGVQNVTGGLKLRPTRVTDDLGRSFLFRYYSPVNRIFDPQAGLLKAVQGPAGTTLEFSYARPADYPGELNEMFLVKVDRTDVPKAADVRAAPDRHIEYQYDWPGGPAVSWDTGTAQVLFQKYLDYYTTFTNCLITTGSACGSVVSIPPRVAGGDPNQLARQQEDAYISTVADNIVRVIADGKTESETRYDVDPASPNFDRVQAQRYGSSQARQDSPAIPPDLPTDHWQSGLPKAVLRYRGAGRTDTDGDPTDGFLPHQIRDRYPLESVPAQAVPPGPRFTPVPNAGTVMASRVGAVIPACNYVLQAVKLKELPGYQPQFLYYDRQSSDPLQRSRLSCGQLAQAQLSDPTHNDLLSALQPITDTPITTDFTITRILGRRAAVSVNANRICTWTELIDRDGNNHYYGLNYLGEVVVDAVQDSSTGDFIFRETLYNADGSVVEQRRPVRGTLPWQPANGFTRYTYDEVDPSANSGWNGWIPVYWSHRGNVVRIEEHAAGSGVLNVDEQSGASNIGIGRYTRLAYEPLFNQVLTVERGSVELLQSSAGRGPVPTDVPHSRVDSVFDYQELALADGAPPNASMKPVLDSLQAWGFNWITKPGPNGPVYDYQAIASWQIPLDFYNTDLNGDGKVGFGYGTNDSDRAKGAAIVAVRTPDRGVGDPERVVTVWSPQGRPGLLAGPDGSLKAYEYYSIAGSGGSGIYGHDRPPENDEVNIGYRGLLGRVRNLRFARSYPQNYGPADVPCPSLAGPYQWLLPSTCSSSPGSELLALGLPRAVVDAILAASAANSRDAWSTQTFSYSELGKGRRMWTDTGSQSTVRDADGRPLEAIDPLGNRAIYNYTVQGYLQRALWTDSHRVVLRDTWQQFDDEGRPVYTCAAKVVSGCDQSNTGTALQGVIRRYEYFPEGSLRRAVDPVGLRTEYGYNERRLLTSARSSPAGSGITDRGKLYSYNDDGDVVGVTSTDFPAPPHQPQQLKETFLYDGLRRLVTLIGTRQYAWQIAYSGRDVVLRFKRDDQPYSGSLKPNNHWESMLTYDGFGRLTARSLNGTVTSRQSLTARGLPFAASADGFGISYTTYDLLGQPVWSRDAAGTQTVYTWRASPHAATFSRIRADTAGNRLTTTSWDELNPVDLPLARTIYGLGAEQHWNWTRDGSGAVLEQRNPRGDAATYGYDLLGWPRSASVQRTRGRDPLFDSSVFDYNDLGEVTSVTDPAGQVTAMTYNGFGELTSRREPGAPSVALSFSYDGLGRLCLEDTGTGTIKHMYAGNGDPTNEAVIAAGAEIPLAQRTLDDLGRITDSTNFNPLDGAPGRGVADHLEYDNLGRTSGDSLQVGAAAAFNGIGTSWKIANGVWQREITYSGGNGPIAWDDSYDGNGRLADMARISGGDHEAQATFKWLGDLYQGRTQKQEPKLGSFREQRSFDAFGNPRAWRYTGIDLTPENQPVDPRVGAIYCGGAWNPAECAAPLLTIGSLRESGGGIASLQWTFGNPVFEGDNLVPTKHPQPWRGYTYDSMSQLHRTWENPGDKDPVSTAGLPANSVSDGEVARLGAQSPSWEYQRETPVGSTVTIQSTQSGAQRWSLTAPRAPGYQIRQLALDSATRNVAYDGAGRIVGDGNRTYRYYPNGTLASVMVDGAPVESYAYDANGRLAAVFDGSGNLSATFIWDGAQMAAAYDGQGQFLWTSLWGPGTDRLVAYFDAQGRDYIPLTDTRNSVVGVWDREHLRLVESAEYNPEGRMQVFHADGQPRCQEEGSGRVCANAGGLPFGVLSAWRSPASGLIYLRSRWYSTELGQFLSHDPVGYADSYNLYAYAGYDPINGWDPLGLSSSGLVGAPPQATDTQTPPTAPTSQGLDVAGVTQTNPLDFDWRSPQGMRQIAFSGVDLSLQERAARFGPQPAFNPERQGPDALGLGFTLWLANTLEATAHTVTATDEAGNFSLDRLGELSNTVLDPINLLGTTLQGIYDTGTNILTGVHALANGDDMTAGGTLIPGILTAGGYLAGVEESLGPFSTEPVAVEATTGAAVGPWSRVPLQGPGESDLNYGTRVHQEMPRILAETNPGAGGTFNVSPGLNGPDVENPTRMNATFAEKKSLWTRQREILRQVRGWSFEGWRFEGFSNEGKVTAQTGRFFFYDRQTGLVFEGIIQTEKYPSGRFRDPTKTGR